MTTILCISASLYICITVYLHHSSHSQIIFRYLLVTFKSGFIMCDHMLVYLPLCILLHFGKTKELTCKWDTSWHISSTTTTTNRIAINYLLHTYLLTYSLTPWSRVLLEKLTGLQLVKKFPAFYGTRRFTTAFTSARQLSLSWASSIQSIPPNPTSWRSISILKK